MSACCSHPAQDAAAAYPVPSGYRRALWIALVVNLALAVVEIGSGLAAGSVSLLADAVDFAGDAANYGLSLAVQAMALQWRTRLAWLKGWTMAGFGVFVIGRAGWSLATGQLPEPLTMGVVGLLALAANLGVALLLYSHRDGDANMRAVWLCTRNDAFGNLAVLTAAAGVFGTGRAWPDLVVAALMATLALSAAREVITRARAESALR